MNLYSSTNEHANVDDVSSKILLGMSTKVSQ